MVHATDTVMTRDAPAQDLVTVCSVLKTQKRWMGSASVQMIMAEIHVKTTQAHVRTNVKCALVPTLAIVSNVQKTLSLTEKLVCALQTMVAMNVSFTLANVILYVLAVTAQVTQIVQHVEKMLKRIQMASASARRTTQEINVKITMVTARMLVPAVKVPILKTVCSAPIMQHESMESANVTQGTQGMTVAYMMVNVTRSAQHALDLPTLTVLRVFIMLRKLMVGVFVRKGIQVMTVQHTLVHVIQSVTGAQALPLRTVLSVQKTLRISGEFVVVRQTGLEMLVIFLMEYVIQYALAVTVQLTQTVSNAQKMRSFRAASASANQDIAVMTVQFTQGPVTPSV